MALMITEITIAIGSMPGRDLTFSLRVYRLDAGAKFGLILAQTIIIPA